MNDVVTLSTDGVLHWYCPGCKGGHGVPVLPVPNGWDWNGSTTLPTVSPSYLVHASIDGTQPRCHCLIRNGMVQFLDDCGHSMRGLTVVLPPWE